MSDTEHPAPFPAGIELRIAWPDPGEELRAAVRDFWIANRAIDDPAEAERRTHELCCVAVDGDDIAGVTTAWTQQVRQLRAPMYAFRVFVSPRHRQRELAVALTIATRETLEAHAAQHPVGAGLGMVAVVQARELQGPTRRPHWRRTKLHLVGYDAQGSQVRAYWFPHAELPSGG